MSVIVPFERVYRGAALVVRPIAVSLLILTSTAAATAQDRLNLEPAERAHLDSKGQITMCVDPDWMPFEKIDADGQHVGIAADFMADFKEMIGTPITLVPTKSWDESLRLAKSRDCDILSLLNESPERRKFLDFTTPYLMSAVVLVTRDDVFFLDGLPALGDRTLGVVEGYVYAEVIERDFPDVQIVSVQSVAEGLRKVSVGEIFAMIGSVFIVSEHISNLGLSNLKIAGQTSLSNEFRIGVRNDDPVLLSALDKAVSSLPETRRNEILRRWYSVEYQHSFDWWLIAQIALAATAIIAVLGYFVLTTRRFNRRLQQEIADREAADRKLVEARELLQDSVDNMSDGFAVYGPDDRLLLCNEKFREFYNYSDKDVGPEASIASLVQLDLSRGFKPFAIDGGPFDEAMRRGQYLVQTPSQRWVEIRNRRTARGDLAGIHMDVTEREEAQRKLQWAEREALKAQHLAEEASRAKSNFLAAISHEIRTPMNGVLAMSRFLLETSLDNEQREYAETIVASGESLLSLLNDVLDQAKIEAGKLDLESIDFDLEAQIDRTVSLLGRQAAEKGLVFASHISSELSRRVNGDPDRLRQILLNLVSNAIKFTDEGAVTVKVAPDRGQTAEPELVRLRIEVADTGVGLDEGQITRLFEPFTQADASTSRRFGGTGLGLSICKQLVELMHGELGCDSRPGSGATFWLTLPFAKAKADSPERPVADVSSLAVGLVEEEPFTRETVRDYLETAGATVALLGPAELRTFFDDPMKSELDVLIVDYNTLGAVRTRPPENFTAAPPILLLSPTGYVDEPQRRASLYAGVVKKPIMRRTLLRAVAAAAGRAVDGAMAAHVVLDRDLRFQAPPQQEAEAENCKILVAEDNPTNRRIIEKLMDRLGTVYEQVEDGELALEALKRGGFGLLLTDCHMPNMDGFELARAVRSAEDKRIKRLPIIALTADAQKSSIERCYAAGMDACLTKPVTLADLDDAITSQLPKVAILRRKVAVEVGPATKCTTGANIVDKGNGKISSDNLDRDVLDLNEIEEAFDEINDEVSDLLAMFFETMERLVVEINEALDDSNMAEAQEAVHQAAGAALNVGAKDISNVLTDMEKALAAGDDARARRGSRNLQAAWARLSAAIENARNHAVSG